MYSFELHSDAVSFDIYLRQLGFFAQTLSPASVTVAVALPAANNGLQSDFQHPGRLYTIHVLFLQLVLHLHQFLQLLLLHTISLNQLVHIKCLRVFCFIYSTLSIPVNFYSLLFLLLIYFLSFLDFVLNVFRFYLFIPFIILNTLLFELSILLNFLVQHVVPDFLVFLPDLVPQFYIFFLGLTYFLLSF